MEYRSNRISSDGQSKTGGYVPSSQTFKSPIVRNEWDSSAHECAHPHSIDMQKLRTNDGKKAKVDGRPPGMAVENESK